jgi:hypothetical protein
MPLQPAAAHIPSFNTDDGRLRREVQRLLCRTSQLLGINTL